MVGVDMKADVMDACNDIARDLGMTGLAFLCADISLYESDEPVDMVISLHPATRQLTLCWEKP